MKQFAERKNITYPIPRHKFSSIIIWLYLEEKTTSLLIHNGKLRGYIISFNVKSTQGMSYEEKVSVFECYNKIVKMIQRQYPKGINKVWQVAEAQWALL